MIYDEAPYTLERPVVEWCSAILHGLAIIACAYLLAATIGGLP